MTHGLEKMFNVPPTDTQEMQDTLKAARKLDEEIPTITDLSTSDKEMDDLAEKAMTSFTDLMDLGMNVEQRYAAPIFDAASKMLGHAVLAKTAKMEKKLKAIDLELKRQRLKQMGAVDPKDGEVEGEAKVLNRNELLRMIKEAKS